LIINDLYNLLIFNGLYKSAIFLKKYSKSFGNSDISSYISSVIRDKDMKDVFYIDGLGWVREITKNRLNESGVPEPYTEYEIVKPL